MEYKYDQNSICSALGLTSVSQPKSQTNRVWPRSQPHNGRPATPKEGATTSIGGVCEGNVVSILKSAKNFDFNMGSNFLKLGVRGELFRFLAVGIENGEMRTVKLELKSGEQMLKSGKKVRNCRE